MDFRLNATSFKKNKEITRKRKKMPQLPMTMWVVPE